MRGARSGYIHYLMKINWGSKDMPGDVRLPGIGSSSVVLITGGSGAIGSRCAEAFLSLGAKVAIMSRSRSSVETTAARFAAVGTVLAIAGDVSNEADAERSVREVLDRWGHLDVLVNCAAIGGNSSVEETDATRIDKMLSVNVKGTLLMIRAAAAPMKVQKHGRIITVSSVMGHRATSASFLYGSSKAAVAHATRSLAVELGPFGITVNCLSPANTPTQLRAVEEAPGTPTDVKGHTQGSEAKLPLRRRGDFDDYVAPILFFASDLASYVTGADVLVDGGLSLLRA